MNDPLGDHKSKILRDHKAKLFNCLFSEIADWLGELDDDELTDEEISNVIAMVLIALSVSTKEAFGRK